MTDYATTYSCAGMVKEKYVHLHGPHIVTLIASNGNISERAITNSRPLNS
jgi:hypothetical protein